MKCSTNVHWFHSTTGSYKDEYCQSSPVSKALDTGLHRQNTLLPEAHAERLISTRFYTLLLYTMYVCLLNYKTKKLVPQNCPIKSQSMEVESHLPQLSVVVGRFVLLPIVGYATSAS